MIKELWKYFEIPYGSWGDREIGETEHSTSIDSHRQGSFDLLMACQMRTNRHPQLKYHSDQKCDEGALKEERNS